MSGMKCYYIKPIQYNFYGVEKYGYDGYIFAQTRGKAQYHAQLALKDVGFNDIKFTDIKLRRTPHLDEYFIEEHKVFDLDTVYSGGR